MSSTTIKNYYAVLGVSRDAQADEIKSAFQAAAKVHHPDKAQDNPFADAHFKELQEAYEVLSHPAKRARYDEECWLRGLFQRKDRIIISPEWILAEAKKLLQHMTEVDTYRMNQAALCEYITMLLSNEHLSIMRRAPQLRGQILQALLLSLKGLHSRYTANVASRLMLLANGERALSEDVEQWKIEKEREALWDRYRPFVVILFALLICGIIWALQRHQNSPL